MFRLTENKVEYLESKTGLSRDQILNTYQIFLVSQFHMKSQNSDLYKTVA
jgi:hypothetical protein